MMADMTAIDSARAPFVQDSLLLDLPATAGTGESGLGGRRDLGSGAWVEWLPRWCPDPDRAFREAFTGIPWRAERRPMYDRVVDVPRLVAHFDPGDDLPIGHLTRLRELVSARFRRELGEPLVSVGLCLYRDGRDSVAWHGDTLGRGATSNTVVAIISLGAERTFALRPRGGGPGHRFRLAHGDLVAMGGSCQRTWDHCIPKTTEPCGPRISVQFRARGVR